MGSRSAERGPSCPRAGPDSRSHNTGKPKRQRAWAPKVPTGCITCRIRHVKCDELKPACNRCVSTGRPCDGYGRKDSVSIFVPSKVRWQASPREHQMFHLLCTETVHQVSGGFGQTFWEVELPRAAQIYPAIWHSCLALAGMHQRTKIATSTEAAVQHARKDFYEFSLFQYNAAIRCLVRIGHQNTLTDEEKETLLVASILFNALCCLQGDTHQAILHAQNGLQLYNHWLYNDQKGGIRPYQRRNGVVTASTLHMLISFTQSQYSNRVTNISSPSSQRYILPHKCSEAAFVSVSDAYFEFQLLFTGLQAIAQFSDSPSPTAQNSPRADKRLAYRREFDVWKAKLHNFEQRSSSLQQAERDKLLLLHILFTGFGVCLHVDLRDAEVDYDKFQSEFAHIVDLAEELLMRQTRNGSTAQTHAGPQFSFSMSLCEVLYWVGIRCRDHSTRRRAISILKSWPRRDGIWDSTLIVPIVETVIKLEEDKMLGGDESGSACGCVPGVFICGSHRVVGVETEFLGDGVAKVTLNTVCNLRRKSEGHIVFLPL